MTEKRADLHIHSTYSDGTLPPAEIIRLAKEAGLAAVSITDHDNVAGCVEAEQAGAAEGVEVVSGVELSAIAEGADVHMLGYCIDVGSESLGEHLGLFRNARRIRAEKMVAKLNKIGLSITIEAANGGTSVFLLDDQVKILPDSHDSIYFDQEADEMRSSA